MNVYAFLYLFGLGLVVLAILGVIGFFVGRAVIRRIRTLRWSPQVGDRVMSRRTSQKGTIDKIDGSRLWFGFYTPNNMDKTTITVTRQDLLFLHRSLRR